MKKITLPLILLLAISSVACVPDNNRLVRIFEAENIHFSADDRLFVTGGKGLYEVINSSAGYQAVLLQGNCNATGMAELQGWLFFPCADFLGSDQLWAYALASGETRFVADLDDYVIANGMVALDENTLLLANTDPLHGNGSIGKLAIAFDSGQPQLLSNEPRWASAGEGLESPNGLRLQGEWLYLSDSNTLKVIELDSQHNIVAVNTLQAPARPLYDDIDPGYSRGVLATSFFEGVIYSVAQDCTLKTDARFLGPSSVRIGRGLFAGKVLVSEKAAHQLSVIDLAVLDSLPCEG
jgi:hypothetical protein